MIRALRVLGVLGGLIAALSVAGSAQQRADRSKPPAIGPAPPINLPQIQKRTLANGLPVWIVEAHEVPLVQVNLLVQTGSGDDGAGKFGVASLTSAMLDEGAGTRSALQISDEVEFLGASLSTTSGWDASAVRLNVPVARLQEALPIMADVALRPTFPQAELDRLRQERLTSLLQARDDPASVAPAAFARVLYGRTHRYGTMAMGTEATLKAFTIADLKAFHGARYRPANATLVVVGDITAAGVMPLVEKHFGAWPGAGTGGASAIAERAPLSPAPQVEQTQVVIVDMPGAEQSQVRIGWIGVPRSTPDYFTLQVLNTILGGSFTSRLNLNLREKNQFSYGASSRFDMRLYPGPFFAGAGIQTDKTAEAIREFFNELNAIGGKPVPADELAKAKNYVALGFPSEFETIEDLASHLEEMIVYKLPDRYFADYVANIQAVTAAGVQKAAATYIQPKRFAVVIAGDRKAIEAGLQKLSVGPIRVLSIDEAMGS